MKPEMEELKAEIWSARGHQFLAIRILQSCWLSLSRERSTYPFIHVMFVGFHELGESIICST